jgi:hypothetical protein
LPSNVEHDEVNDTLVALGDGSHHGNDKSGEDDDARKGDVREDESNTEALEGLGDSHEEIGALDFLLRYTLRDVVREHTTQRGLGQITKEDQAASCQIMFLARIGYTHKNDHLQEDTKEPVS